MISFKTQATFDKLLNIYLQSNNRFNQFLDQLCRFYDQKQYQKGIKFLQIKASKLKFVNYHQAIKWLMLVQKIIALGFNTDNIENLLQIISYKIGQIKSKQSSFDKLIKEKLVQPYNLYLKKRIQSLPKSVSEKDVCFYLINLINSSSKCNEVLFLMGRYYQSQCNYAQDFNYIMADDVRGLYRILSKKLKNVNQNQNEENLGQFEDIIENMHQSMYTLFYNRYFYRSVYNLVPNWIELKFTKKKIFSQKNVLLDETLHSSTMSIDSQISHISKSCKKKDMTLEDIQQSIQMIKSMQRVVELCQLQNVDF